MLASQNNKMKIYVFFLFSSLIIPEILSKPLQLSLSSLDQDPIQILFALGDTHQSRLISFADDTFALTHNDHMALLYNKETEELSSDYIFHAENDVVLNDLTDNLLYQDVLQWKLWDYEDFQSPLSGWSKDTVSACGNNGNLFLGGHCNFANDFVYKIYEGIPKHSQVIIIFNVFSMVFF